jgi:hypothetical protein
MLWGKRTKRRLFQPMAGFLLALLVVQIFDDITPSGFIFELAERAYAAQATIDSSVSTATTEHTILGSGTVFVSDQTGYKFYVDSSGACVYSKSTNAGGSWGTATVVNSVNSCFGVVVWYDRWTPGDSGDYIHILSAESTNHALWYNRLDTTTDTLLGSASGVNAVANTGQGGTFAASVINGSITKSTDGTIYMAMNNTTDSYVVECSSNCGVGTSWTETGTNPMDNVRDFSLLMPLAGGDILLINRDIDADDLRSKVWDDSAGNWSGSWTTLNANAPENSTYDPAFSAVADIATGDIYLAYIDWATNAVGGNNDDVRTAIYSGGSWSNATDVVTDSALGLTGVSMGIDGNTGNVYVAYTGQTTPLTPATANVYWKSSTDGMSSWGSEQGPVNTSSEDIYGVDINNYDYERLYVSWYGAASDDMLGDTIADIAPVFVVGTAGTQKATVRPQTDDFYLGGTFVLKENAATRDVTSITISETGSANAANDLKNIRLYYDLDTSAPYDCESESYGGSESQFGSTDADGFSGANGTSTFTDTVSISPTVTLCAYVVLDVAKYVTEWTEIDVEITSPATDVIVSGGVTAVPPSTLALDGATLVKPDTDFKVQRGVSTITGDTLTLTAGVDYEAPASASSAFIRITNTGHTGAGKNTGGGTNNADDTTVYITNPDNILNDVTLARGSGSTANTRVSWEIVEYRGASGGDNEIIVRRQEAVSYVSGNTTVDGAVTGSVTDNADVVVFITGQRNNNTGSAAYNRGASTAVWNAGSGRAVFTRGATGDVADVSYAVVEFTGSNWRVQRAEHTFSAAGSTETESISPVNSLARTFLHTQKSFSVSTHANFGTEAWLSGIGQVSFLLDADATTPNGQVAVVWVIENIQTAGNPMVVTRSNGTLASSGTSPQSSLVSIGKTLDDVTSASIFTNNTSDTNTNTWPEPILGVQLISDTQYELWRSDSASNINYRTEIVEWPTAERKLHQNYYRLYANNDALLPTDPWPAGGANLGENTEMTASDEPTAPGDIVRIRMTVAVSGARLPVAGDSFKLQYAPRVTTCDATVAWSDLGDIGSTTAGWRGVDATPVDGTALSGDPPTGGDLLISVSDIAGTYNEENNTPTNPFMALTGDDIEFDWIVQHHNASDKTSYCFRMTEADGTLFHTYINYPVIRTVGYEPLMTNWRWYDDENNVTPTSPLGDENISPSNIRNQSILKLRASLRESSGAAGVDVKFAVQYSEYADFSQDVHTLISTTSCISNSVWCYADGAGTDNAVITSKVISSADACSGGVGTGCGTHNESTSTTTATFDQLALTDTEFEFTIKQSGADPNIVYYFRLYNLTYDEVVGVADTFSNPSLVTEGAALSTAIDSVAPGTVVAGVTTDVATTPTTISFGDLPFNTDWTAAQQISITTNAIEGYQVLMFASQNLLNELGDTIEPILGTNAVPTSWSTGCLVSASSCFGYHTTDATLAGGSGRFAPLDSYALLETTPQEVMHSSIPTTDVEYILFRIRVAVNQPPGDYESDVRYIAVPVH